MAESRQLGQILVRAKLITGAELATIGRWKGGGSWTVCPYCCARAAPPAGDGWRGRIDWLLRKARPAGA